MPTFPNPMGMLRTTGTGTSGAGRTAFGSVPGPIGVPPNLFTQLSGAVPNFGANTGGAGNVIGSELSGQVSPQTMNALKTASAQFGVASGMPGSGLEANQLFGNIAGFSENRQRQGVQDYLAEAGTLGHTMTDPVLAAEIGARNADLAAAPDPAKAHQQQLDDWLKGLSTTYALSNPSRGPWWAPGGVTTPPMGATIGRSYAGAGGTIGSSNPFGSADAFGYNYSAPEAGTTGVVGAINPTGTGVPNLSHFYPGAAPDEEGAGYSDPSYGQYAGYSGG